VLQRNPKVSETTSVWLSSLLWRVFPNSANKVVHSLNAHVTSHLFFALVVLFVLRDPSDVFAKRDAHVTLVALPDLVILAFAEAVMAALLVVLITTDVTDVNVTAVVVFAAQRRAVVVV